VKPFVASQAPQLSIVGDDDVQLAPEQVVNVAICLHELATNATKYGAWSAPGGRVTVSWRRAEPPRFQLEWLEEGGPAVAEPQTIGFGARILQRILSSQGQSLATIEFAPEGVRWRAEFVPASAQEPSLAGGRGRRR
jgi:two-component sensor histidine kinase